VVATTHPVKRILLVDDDITTQESMSVILASDGYRVAVARNGADALDRLRGAERPELILLDLRMPVMDGCAFCRSRQEYPELSSIPVVVVSGLPDAAEQARKIGAMACLRKPIDTLALLTTLREYCARELVGAGVGGTAPALVNSPV